MLVITLCNTKTVLGLADSGYQQLSVTLKGLDVQRFFSHESVPICFCRLSNGGGGCKAWRRRLCDETVPTEDGSAGLC